MHRNYIDIVLELFMCNKYKYNQFNIINGKKYILFWDKNYTEKAIIL